MTPEYNLGKVLILVGALIVMVGVVFLFKDQIPGLSRLGRLPGDLKYESKNVKIYFPLMTSILLSAILSLILWLLRK